MSKKSQIAAELADLEANKATWYPLKKRHREQTAAPVVKSHAHDDDDKMSDESSYEKDGFDEDLFIDEEDRQKLLAMPEMAREVILMERSEKRKDLEERNEFRRQQRAERRAKMGLASKETEEPARKRQKTEQKKALEDLAKKRKKERSPADDLYDENDDEEDEEAQPRRRGRRSRRDEEEDEDFMDVVEKDDEANVDVSSKQTERQEDRKERRLKEVSPLDSVITAEEAERLLASAAKLEDFRRIVVKRTHAEQWFGEPYWNNVIPGLFCRIHVGKDDSRSDKPIYRVAQIEYSKTYKLGTKECNQVAVLSLMGKQKPFELRYLSNQDVSEEEYDYYKKAQISGRQPLITLAEVDRLALQVEEAMNYRYTEDDIAEQVRLNRAKKKDPVHLFKDKTRIKDEIEEARQEGDVHREQQLLTQLEEILKKEEELKFIVERSRPVKVSELNQKRHANYFKQLDEEREFIIQRERAEMEGRVSIDDDPFARRKTFGGGSAADMSKNSVVDKKEAAKADTPVQSEVAQLDLDDHASSTSGVLPPASVDSSSSTSSASAIPASGKKISLADYMLRVKK